MSQDWVADLYTTGTVGDTTLANMELMFATLRSSFSGSSAPSNPVDGNLWYDSSAKELLKAYRNAAWAGVLVGSVALKLYIWRNTAEDGWVIDTTSSTDRVLAFKGGSTYTAGGANAGTWTISGLTKDAHTHLDGTLSVQNHSHPLTRTQVGVNDQWPTSYRQEQTSTNNATAGITGSTGVQSDAGISSSGAWRISAAVGTMQYPNI